MRFDIFALVLAVLCIDIALVNAGLYIVQPSVGSTCRGGQACTVHWLDDGTRPLLAAIGVSTVGLYTGKQQLVQTISPVDVSAQASITFIPNPDAGPNSDSYYISITSTSLKGNNSTPYSGWSPFFQLVGMKGSFDAPLPVATSTIPIPASLSQSTSSSGTRTITVGTLITTSTSPTSTGNTLDPSSSSPSVSRIATSILPSSPTPISTSTPNTSQVPITSGASRSITAFLSCSYTVVLLSISTYFYIF